MRIQITIEADFVNFNPPNIYDPSPEQVREALLTVLKENEQSIWLDTERKTGFLQKDLFPTFNTAVTIL